MCYCFTEGSVVCTDRFTKCKLFPVFRISYLAFVNRAGSSFSIEICLTKIAVESQELVKQQILEDSHFESTMQWPHGDTSYQPFFVIIHFGVQSSNDLKRMNMSCCLQFLPQSFPLPIRAVSELSGVKAENFWQQPQS